MEDARGEFEAAHYAQAEQLADAEAELATLRGQAAAAEPLAMQVTSQLLFLCFSETRPTPPDAQSRIGAHPHTEHRCLSRRARRHWARPSPPSAQSPGSAARPPPASSVTLPRSSAAVPSP